MSKYLHSEIFDEYAKIALDKGLITKEAKKIEEPDKYEGVDIEAIEMLYGVKPNGKDEKHIVEQAHPEPVIVAPAYDRVHGRIENQLEQQDMIANIALKPNDGKLVQRRYVVAYNELLDELLTLGFMLDKKGYQDLMKLADSCAGRLSDKEITKVAWTWSDFGDFLVAGGITGGVGALVGTLATTGWGIAAAGAIVGVMLIVNNFSDHIDRGVTENCDSVISNLQRVLDEDEEGKGLDEEIQGMIDNIAFVRDIGLKAMETFLNMESKDDINKGAIITKKYSSAIRILLKEIPAWNRLLTKSSNIRGADRGSEVGILSDMWNVFERGYDFMVTSDIEKAIKSLNTLKDSLIKSKKSLEDLYKASKEAVQSNKENIEELVEQEFKKGDIKDPDKETKDEAKGLTDELFQSKSKV